MTENQTRERLFQISNGAMEENHRSRRIADRWRFEDLKFDGSKI